MIDYRLLKTNGDSICSESGSSVEGSAAPLGNVNWLGPCQPTAIHLQQEAGSLTLAAAGAQMMQGRRPSAQKASVLPSRDFAFLAIILIAISEAIDAAIQGNEGKPRQRFSQSLTLSTQKQTAFRR